ncbi:MAG: peptidase S24 [Nitrospirae bacterium RIFCSPLOWO2_02_FULL_62_14]|nr:MAG: peptidase S24 [Nitrospirae bacterium RIFCSPLOWO2_02_FULL_62_14]OGW68470.1 MAG: peptidase S24 [Nitrospirae bacterium RIFCSPLOWO2_01_FULL_62_17]
MTTKVEIAYEPDTATAVERPVWLARVPAGFPSPADDYLEGKLDLNQHLIKHPAATYFVRVTGDSMIGAGIHSGDLLVVDRSLEPADNSVVIAIVDGELTVKRLSTRQGRPWLLPDNDKYPPVEVREDSLQIWGVVTHVIHKV